MKRNKIIAVALVVMMMVGAIVLMSCSNCPGDGTCKVTGPDDAKGLLDSCMYDSYKDYAAGKKTYDEYIQALKDCVGDATSYPFTCGC
jgi:hypothetical protein